MNRLITSFHLSLIAKSCALILLFAFTVSTQQPPVESNLKVGTLPPQEVARIINAFAAKETEFRKALNSYSYRREAEINTLGFGGQITGSYLRKSNMTFDEQGKRIEKITRFPMPTFNGVTQEDLQDLGGVNPFPLEPSKLNQYDIKYVGTEKIDELDTYVFDVEPLVLRDKKAVKQATKNVERFFLGRVWVDRQDLQIVKSRGKGVPETKINKFPVVETYREQVDNKYWFPTYVYGDDTLVFDNGQSLRLKMLVRYKDFNVGRSTVTLEDDDGTVVEDEKPTPAQPAAPPTPRKP